MTFCFLVKVFNKHLSKNPDLIVNLLIGKLIGLLSLPLLDKDGVRKDLEFACLWLSKMDQKIGSIDLLRQGHCGTLKKRIMCGFINLNQPNSLKYRLRKSKVGKIQGIFPNQSNRDEENIFSQTPEGNALSSEVEVFES